MSQKVLVTGAAGFIGSHVCERLLNAGYRVAGIDSFTDYYDVRLKQDNLSRCSKHDNFYFIAGSVNDVGLDDLLSGVDYVFHQAAQPGVRASWGSRFEEYIDSNIRATQRLCETAKDKDLKRFIYAGSSSVYGETTKLPMNENHPTRPVSPYGLTKLDAENLCLMYRANYGLPAVCLRYFTVFGPRQRPDMALHRFLKGALTGTPVEVYGNGSQTRDFTYVADIVTANVLAMDYDGGEAVFNIGGGSRVTINHLLDLVATYSVGDFDVRYKDKERGDVAHTFADTALARAELGYSPKTSLEEGIEREVDWLRSVPRILSGA
jgi:UDP-glucose 4-epimerase